MGYPSRDWRQSDPSRNHGRFRDLEESRRHGSDFGRGDFGRDQDEDWSRSAEGIGDYGGYDDQGERRFGRSGRYGGYTEEEESYRNPRYLRESQRGWRGEDRNESGRYAGERSRFEESRFGRGGYGQDYGDDSRYGRGEGDFRTQPWRERPMEGWSGDRYPHRDFTHGRGGDYESGGRPGRGGWDRQDWRAGSMTSAYDSGYGQGQGYGQGYGQGQGYGSSGSSGLTNWGRSSQRGKGPKGYERSDDRLKEVICERLADDPDIDASEITLNVTGGTVRLSGTVDSRNDKYAVEEMIANCSGVKDVDNQLRVQSSQQRDSASTGYGGSSQSAQENVGQSTSRSTSTTTGTSGTRKQ